MSPARRQLVAHLLLLLAVSVAYEAAFVPYYLNVLDEGWPLYAAMRLHQGGVLYDDVFFVFPPGHLLVAWIAYALDPPGVVLSRILYAAFSVALCVAMYGLGRRLMPPRYALAGALLLAVGASREHLLQLLFGYRYLVIGVLALLAFARHLDRRDRRWLFAAGVLTGLLLVTRLTPAFAVGCAIGVGVLAAPNRWRDRLGDWAIYGAGVAIAAAPVVAWFAHSVGLEKMWLEAVYRPVAMTQLQSLPIPPWSWSPRSGARHHVRSWFVAVQFRAWVLLYAGYAIGLGVVWLRARRDRRPFPDALLLTVVVWGAVYLLRSFGRSDGPHLYSAYPPVCLLLAHAASLLTRPARVGAARPAMAALGAILLGLWMWLNWSEQAFDPEVKGQYPLAVLDDRVKVRRDGGMPEFEKDLEVIQRVTRPGDTILDLSASSMIYVLADRLGPGYADVVMPGTFLDEAEERAFVERLERDPPALVVFPAWDFDNRPDRAVRKSAPLLTRWVWERYQSYGNYREPKRRLRQRFVLMRPRAAPGASDAP